jgi:hypothetical protein
VRSPWSGDWLTVLGGGEPTENAWRWRAPGGGAADGGTYVFRSRQGIDGPFEGGRISDTYHEVMRQPLPLRSRNRWIVAAQVPPRISDDGRFHIVVLRSDDDGATWEQSGVDAVERHRIEWPHRGVRWQNDGCEPSIAELGDGRLWMLIRTSLDMHYEAFSEDAGATWSKPRPSRFYATLTMPLVYRTSSGRLLVFWNNTAPLPEVDHETQPELNDNERRGRSEDVFTNRDAFHAACSDDDGLTWTGFRELLLNEHRNDADFRSSGGNAGSVDKSIHQSQALELPAGKVLVSVGQHRFCRRMLIFDPDWLAERERSDDFSGGLGGWSTHQFVKGWAGNFRGISGHCAYNRRPGAQLVPDPAGEPREVLRIARHPDPRLVHEAEGAVWNFPAGKAGELTLRIRLPRGTDGARLCLLDCWFNPVDPVAHRFAQYVIEIDRAGRVNGAAVLPFATWTTVAVRWTDCTNADAELRIGEKWTPLPLVRAGANGISYLHAQSAAEGSDPAGMLLGSVRASVEPGVST